VNVALFATGLLIAALAASSAFFWMSGWEAGRRSAAADRKEQQT